MEYHIRFATFLTELLDSKFSILGVRFGLDPLLNLFPIVGDVLTALISFYLVWIAHQIHVPKEKIHEMVGNVIFDFVMGLIPIVGDIGDFFYRANSKNLKIIKQYYSPAIEAEILSSRSLTPAIYK